MIQLPIPLPMRVVGGIAGKQAYIGPVGNCMAIGWIKPHSEHHLVWICIMDDTGECWEVEQPFIRARSNMTWGRNVST